MSQLSTARRRCGADEGKSGIEAAKRQPGSLSPRSGKAIRRALGISPTVVREALVGLRTQALQEDTDGVDPKLPRWKIMSAALAVCITRSTVGGGRNPAIRVNRRAREILMEAKKEMNRVDLDRKTAMYLAGMLLGLLPFRPGRSIAGITDLERALGQKRATRMKIIETALRLLPKHHGPKGALWAALCTLGERPSDMPEKEFTNLLKRFSDARHGR